MGIDSTKKWVARRRESKSLYKPANVKLQRNIELPAEFLSDVLVTAAEGGSNYWAAILDPIFALNEVNESVLVAADFADKEDLGDKPSLGTVTLDSIAKGIQIVLDNNLPNHSLDVRSDIIRSIESAVNENPPDAGQIDDECADVIVQLALFNTIIYG